MLVVIAIHVNYVCGDILLWTKIISQRVSRLLYLILNLPLLPHPSHLSGLVHEGAKAGVYGVIVVWNVLYFSASGGSNKYDISKDLVAEKKK